MEYECGPVLLYSQDKIRLMDFLSDVFEFEVDSISGSLYRGPLYLQIIEDQNQNTQSKNQSVIFSFKVKYEIELKEIMSKYNFFLYRKNHSHTPQENIELIQSENMTSLTLFDVDQRQWRFDLETRLGF